MKTIKNMIIGMILLLGLLSSVSAEVFQNDVEYLPPELNLGIGVEDPAAKLEVNGQIMITGGNPQAGYVLTSDANGLGSWLPPAAGSNFDSAIFLDEDGYLNFTSFASEFHGADLKLGLDDGRNIGERTGQRALVHDDNDTLHINYDRDFEGGVSISQGALTIDDDQVVHINGRLDGAKQALSPLVAHIGANYELTVPANRCADAMRIDYKAAYQLKSMGGVFLNLYVNDVNVNSTRFATWWGEPGNVFFESHQSNYHILTDMSQEYKIRLERSTYDGTSIHVINKPLLDVTCIGLSGRPE